MTAVDMRTGEIVEDAPTTSLATLDPSEIDRAADPAAFVVLCCERAKNWLTEATTHGDIEQIVELKSQAEAIRVYTVQKQLGKDSELAAQEIVRRAERGIGVCIRKGQEAGRIETLSEARSRARLGQQNADGTLSKPRPRDFTDPDSLHDAVTVTDGVSDEQFEAALSDARSEGNLSRANVVRKVKGEPGKTTSERPEHLRKTRRHDSNRMVAEIVNGLEGYVMVLNLIDFEQVSPENVIGWSDSLATSLRALNRLNRQLKELNQP